MKRQKSLRYTEAGSTVLSDWVRQTAAEIFEVSFSQQSNPDLFQSAKTHTGLLKI